MKVVAYVGSPDKNGNTATLVKRICDVAAARGAQTTIHHIYDWDLRGCRACEGCKQKRVEWCTIDDDFTRHLPELVAADAVVVATPVYFGHVSGPTKVFLDRWCTFFDQDFKLRCVPGKKLATITASGAPSEQFKDVNEYLLKWFGGFFKLKHVGSIVAGGLKRGVDAQSRPDLLRRADELGALL